MKFWRLSYTFSRRWTSGRYYHFPMLWAENLFNFCGKHACGHLSQSHNNPSPTYLEAFFQFHSISILPNTSCPTWSAHTLCPTPHRLLDYTRRPLYATSTSCSKTGSTTLPSASLRSSPMSLVGVSSHQTHHLCLPIRPHFRGTICLPFKRTNPPSMSLGSPFPRKSSGDSQRTLPNSSRAL